MKNWVLVQSGPRKDLKDWFLLVPFGALFEGCLGTEKSTSKKRVLAMRPLTTQDMADASSSVLIELMNCRRRCGKAVCFPDLGAESRRITLNLGWCRRPSRGKKNTKNAQGFVGALWCFFWRPSGQKRGHLRKAGSSFRTLGKAEDGSCILEFLKTNLANEVGILRGLCGSVGDSHIAC